MKIRFPSIYDEYKKGKRSDGRVRDREKVLCGIHGVCCVSDVEERTVDRIKRQYLALGIEPEKVGSYILSAMNEE